MIALVDNKVRFAKLLEMFYMKRKFFPKSSSSWSLGHGVVWKQTKNYNTTIFFHNLVVHSHLTPDPISSKHDSYVQSYLKIFSEMLSFHPTFNVLTACQNSRYGENCTMICGSCKDNAPCDVTSGQCDNGCTAGMKGTFCDIGL